MIRRKIKHISPELPQMLELADKNVKIVFITIVKVKKRDEKIYFKKIKLLKIKITVS